MNFNRFPGDVEEVEPLNRARRIREVLVDEGLLEAHGLKDLRAHIGHVGRDAHAGHDLVETLVDRVDVVLFKALPVLFRSGEALNDGEREIGMHGLGAVAAQSRKVVNRARGARFNDKARARAQAVLNEALVNGRSCKKRRNGDAVAIHLAVREDQDVDAALHGIDRGGANARQARFNAVGAPGERIRDVEFARMELVVRKAADRADALHLRFSEHRLLDLKANRGIRCHDVEEVRTRTDEAYERRHHFLADRIDRRVRHLSEKLTEIVVEHLRTL